MSLMDRLVLGAIKRRWKKFRKKGVIKVPLNIETVTYDQLQIGDIILFYHGNKLTEFHGKFRRAELGKLDLVPYHAAMVYDISERNVYIVDPETRTTASLLTEYTNVKKLRIEIIRYPITAAERECLFIFATKAVEEELYYDFRGYGSFVSDMPGLGWTGKVIDKLKWLKPSKKSFFCSDFDASAYKECVKSCKVSSRPPNKTAPVDLLKYALKSRKAKRLLLKAVGA